MLLTGLQDAEVLLRLVEFAHAVHPLVGAGEDAPLAHVRAEHREEVAGVVAAEEASNPGVFADSEALDVGEELGAVGWSCAHRAFRDET